ncbi:YopX family protein [Staphylococcus hominis]|uniref:YopX family protein n=1 Tax=Staphylococcus hominis TaxID=1290 RepID=UPI002878A8B8|nr:YopX family protein [Staphylococcus hominis]MDS3874868.1 YopX family protein [Staphylococcus hominis]
MIPKFRAWDKDHKYMEYTDRNLIVSFGDNGNVDATDLSNIYSTCNGMQNFELMQSTGLKDKNGTEIYEGDIVKNIYDEIYVVKWFDAAFYLEEKYNGGFDYHELHFEDNKKVIGNIYENPELLEDE